MLSAMMVVYGFVSGGPGARALQLTTPSFHSLHNDSSEYSLSRASRGCGNNLGCHLETRVAKESIPSGSVEPESIEPFISPRRQAAWRMQFVPYRAEALIVEHEEQHVSQFGQSETPCVFHRRVDRTACEQTELDLSFPSYCSSLPATSGSGTWLVPTHGAVRPRRHRYDDSGDALQSSSARSLARAGRSGLPALQGHNRASA